MKRRNTLAVLFQAVLLGSLLAATGHVWAASDTWLGTSGTGWNTPGNWNLPAVPSNGDTLVYTGAGGTSNNDTATVTSLGGISFATSAGAYTLTGTPTLALTGAITDNTANGTAEAINFAINGTAASSLVFGSDGSGSNSVTLGATDTFGALTVSSNSANADTLSIGSGNTLTITGTTNSNIGIAATSASNTTASLTITGGGSYNQTGGNLVVAVTSGNNNNGTQTSTLDASGLSAFTYNNSTGSVLVGFGAKSNGTLRLANAGSAANAITAATVSVGDSNNGNNGGTSTLSLGGGTNVIHATTINLGAGKAVGIMNFQGMGGALTITGLTGGASTANITLGRQSSATGTSTASQLLLAGHNATVQAGTVNDGQLNGATANTATGNITFDTGTFSAVTLALAVDTSGADSGGAKGTFVLGASSASTGVLNVTSNFFLTNVTSTSTTARTDTAEFDINGGTANISTNILVNGSQTGVTQSSTIKLNAGTLSMGNGTTNFAIGTSTALISTFSMPSAGSTGTIQNLGGGGIFSTGGTGATSTAGGLSMGGTGTLILAGTDTYSGNTTVNNGALLVNGTLAANGAAAVSVSGGLLGGTGTVNRAVTLGSGTLTGGTGAAGAGGATGTLTLANGLTMNGGNLLFNFGTSSNNSINITGGPVTFNSAGFSFLLGGSPAPGTYTVLTSANAFAPGGLNFSSSSVGRTTFQPVSFSGTSNILQVTISGSAANLTWNNSVGGGDGTTWDTSQLNWTSSASTNPNQYFDGDNVLFNDSNNFPTNPNAYNVQLNSTVNPGSVTFSNGPSISTYTISGGGQIAGTTGLTVNGGGTVDISALSNNSYTGNTTISGGSTLIISTLANAGSNSSVGAAGTNIVIDGGTLVWKGGSTQTTNRGITITPNGATLEADPTSGGQGITISGPITMSGSGARILTLTGTDTSLATQSISSTISDGAGGATSIVKNGNGSWQLAAANNYNGGTTINLGRIRITNVGALGGGNVTISNGGQVYINGNGTVVNNFSIAGNGVTETDGSLAGALRIGNANNILTGLITLTGDARITARNSTASTVTISGQITGNHNLELGNGGGTTVNTITLSNLSNNWGGSTTISFGTVKAGASSGATSGVIPHGAGAGDITINGGNGGNATLDLNGFNVTINGLNSTAGTDSQDFVTNSSTGSASVLTVGDNDANGTYTGVVQDGGNSIGLTKIGNGNQILMNTANPYTGATTVSGGTLTIKASSSINSTPTISVASTGIFDVTDFGGGGMSIGSSVAQTLVANGAVHGTINLSSSGTLAGTGTIDSLMTQGGSSIRPGSATADGNVGTLNIGSNLSVGGGDMRFDIAGATNDKILIGASGTASYNAGSTITIAPTSTFALGTTNYVLVNLLNTSSTIGYGGGPPSLNNTAIGRNTFHLDTSSNPNEILLVATGVAAGNLFWTGSNGNSWDIQGTQSWLNTNTTSQDAYFDGDSVTFDTAHNTTSTFSVSLNATVAPGSVTVTNGNYTLSGGTITGSTGLTISGGSLNFQSTGTYVGNTTVSGGATLQITGAGSINGSAVKIQNGTVKVGSSSALGATTPVTLGDGGSNSGLLDLNGQAVSVTSVNVSGTGASNTIGNSIATPATLTASGASNIGSGGTLRVTGITSATFSGINGAGNIVVGDSANAAGLTVTGSGGLSGTITVNPNATLTIASGGSISSSTGITLAGATEVFSNTVSANNFGTGSTISVTGANSLLKYGANALANALQNPISIGAIASVTIDVNDSNGTTKTTYNDSGALTGSGPLTVINSGTDLVDTYQLSGNNSSYSGNISVGTTGSTIRLQPTTANGLGSGSVTVASGSEVFFSAGGTYTNNFNITGIGSTVDVPSYGAIRFVNGLTSTGNITLSGDATISGGTSGAFATTMNGQITGAHALTLMSGTFTLNNTTANADNYGPAGAGSIATILGNYNNLAAQVATVILKNTNSISTGGLQMQGAVLRLDNNSISIANLSSTGTLAGSSVISDDGPDVTGGSGTVTLTFGDSSGTVATPNAYAGTLIDGTSGGKLAIVKTGTGVESLTGLSTFTGNVTVQQGELIAASTISQSDGSNGPLGKTGSPGGRTITVNSSSTLELDINNVFGGNGNLASNLPAIVNNGTVNATQYNQIGNITLNGATLSQTSTSTGNYGGYQFLGSVTVGGAAPSTISSGNTAANHLGTNTSFNVADVTGNSTVDLTVSAGLRDQ
ncbi:MAG TPA: autotransporter-associated beta strand repeat-containing protein, partial [Pirellulales bacterium]|nr:autotransporter-associated beta strand repeat-containing protein [Pirellulales bacterium]